MGYSSGKWLLLPLALLCAAPLTAMPSLDAAIDWQGEGAAMHAEVAADPGARSQPPLADSAADALQFLPAASDAPSFGFESGARWIRFQLTNSAGASRLMVVDMGYAMLDDVRLYVVSADGQISEQRSGDTMPYDQRPLDYRNPAFQILVHPGQTLRCYLRIETESSMALPIRFWSAAAFQDHERLESVIYSMYFAALAVMFFYNLILLASIRDISYLYYLAYLLCVSLFLFTLNGLSFRLLWPQLPRWGNSALPVFIELCFTFGLLFTRRYLDTRTHMPTFDRLLLGLSISGIPLALVSPLVSYRLAIVAATGLAFIVACCALAASILGAIRRAREARYYLIAWCAMLVGIGLYSLKTFAILPNTLLTANSMQVGILLQVVLLSLGLADRINLLRLDLKQKLEDLSHADAAIRASESRYRLLVESGRDIVLLLDPQGVILSANRAIQEHLGRRAEEAVGQNFQSLLFRSPELSELLPDMDLHGEFLSRQFRELDRHGGSQVFKAEFATRLGELRHMEVRLDSIESAGQRLILARAGEALDDSLARFVESESQNFVIGNFINIGDLISQRICKNLSKYADPATTLGLEIGVREMVINAIEHGNLAVTYEEKTHTQSRDAYFQFLLERQKDPRYRDRKVRIQYSLNRRRVFYVIRDEGAGFDHRKMSRQGHQQSNEQQLAHGRGISMARSVFDVIRYNDSGNQVMMMKRFDRSPAAPA
ncbi:MAG: ATP-binding protein [Leptospirales bacterium]|nr:ATP-binding protein [Leptospirales bacterium]